MDLATLLNAAEVEALALDKQPTGYTASVFYSVGKWSPRVFAGTASEAIEKALRLHGQKRVVAAPTIAPPSRSDAPVSIAPPPY